MFLKNLIWHNFRLRKVARVIQRIPGYPSLKVNSCLLSLFLNHLRVIPPNISMFFPSKNSEFSYITTVQWSKLEN